MDGQGSDASLRELILRWKGDGGATNRSWFLWSERPRNFRSIRSGLQVVAAEIRDGAFAIAYRGSSLETVVHSVTEPRQIFKGADHAFLWQQFDDRAAVQIGGSSPGVVQNARHAPSRVKTAEDRTKDSTYPSLWQIVIDEDAQLDLFGASRRHLKAKLIRPDRQQMFAGQCLPDLSFGRISDDDDLIGPEPQAEKASSNVDARTEVPTLLRAEHILHLAAQHHRGGLRHVTSQSRGIVEQREDQLGRSVNERGS